MREGSNKDTDKLWIGLFVLVRSTLTNLDKSDDDDECECQELGGGEEILHSGGRPHTVAVYKRQQDCREKERHKDTGRLLEEELT